MNNRPGVVIVGGGFAGLNAARVLGSHGFSVTIFDRNNYHLFQPLLYQVATGFLAPGDIAGPIRSAVARYQSVRVLHDDIIDVDPQQKLVQTKTGSYPYEKLIIATGVTHSYFGHEEWEKDAPGLKTIGDAIDIRSRVLEVFEAAERCESAEERKRILSLVVVGGGPTGVELAGALSELARSTLKGEFRNCNPEDVRITLVEGGSRVLGTFHEKTSLYAEKVLKGLGVDVRTSTRVVGVEKDFVQLDAGGTREKFDARVVLWAAGVKASALSAVIVKKTGAACDRSGKIEVNPDLSIPNFPDVFVLGDAATLKGSDGSPLPGLAPVAIQQGAYVGKLIVERAAGRSGEPFKYFDKGSMAVIGRGRAVAESWKLRLSGFPAWLAWAVIHIYYLIEFENKFIVFFHWGWNYLTNKRGSRIITKG